MLKSVIIICIYFIIFILVIIGLIILLKKQEGTFKKALMILIVSILSFLFENYLQIGVNFFSENLSVVLNYILPNKDNISNNKNILTPNNNFNNKGKENIIDSDEKSDNKSSHVHETNKEVQEVIKNATCTNKGEYEIIEYCECGTEMNRTTHTVKKLGHNYSLTFLNKPTCEEQGSTTFTCDRCGESYIEYKNSLGHHYKNGICTRCKRPDPNYVTIYNSKKIMKILSNSVVSDSGTYKAYLGTDTISVFAKDKHNCFSINTAVSYNLWGGNVQTVIFNVLDLKDVNKLKFKIGGETGSSGSMTVEIFMDKSFDDTADYSYDIGASDIPTKVSIKIKNTTSLGIRVTNHSNHENRLVFFGFSGDTGKN